MKAGSNYANGGWDKEISGFWIAKFEAGYVGQAANPSSAVDSSVQYSTLKSWTGIKNDDNYKHIYYNTRELGGAIKWPTFSPTRPSFNFIGISDAYSLCRELSSKTSPFKLSNIDSHLVKNSEWGAVAYLSYSDYGTNGNRIVENSSQTDGWYGSRAVTGYGDVAEEVDNKPVKGDVLVLSPTKNFVWSSTNGQKASTTGNIYGVYDMSGGASEWVSGYVASGNNYVGYAGRLSGDNNKYKSRYQIGDDEEIYSIQVNQKRKGEAIWETSSDGKGNTSWDEGNSLSVSTWNAFFTRGGHYDIGGKAGIFSFASETGWCAPHIGFRCVLINN